MYYQCSYLDVFCQSSVSLRALCQSFAAKKQGEIGRSGAASSICANNAAKQQLVGPDKTVIVSENSFVSQIRDAGKVTSWVFRVKHTHQAAPS